MVDSKTIGMKIFIILGIYVSFIISGVFEERLYKGHFLDKNGNKFRFDLPIIALFLNGLISYLISCYVLWG
jgi:hypothetical protein